jgi:MFS family permease
MLEYLERQKKLTANQWKIIATSNVGDMLDFFDFFLSVCAGVYTQGIAVDLWTVGADPDFCRRRSGPRRLLLGWMGDRIGRRKVFILTALNVAFATG